MYAIRSYYDAHSIAGLAHAALDDIARAELLADLLDVHRLALEDEGRIAGNHEERMETAEPGDDVLGQAVREVLLLAIARHVVERQYGDLV